MKTNKPFDFTPPDRDDQIERAMKAMEDFYLMWKLYEKFAEEAKHPYKKQLYRQFANNIKSTLEGLAFISFDTKN